MKTPHLNENELNRWVDGTLGSVRRASVSDHLEACTECAENVSALRAQVQTLTRYRPSVEVPMDFAASVMAAIAHEPIPVQRRSFSDVLLATCAVVGLFVPIVVMILSGKWVEVLTDEIESVRGVAELLSGLWTVARASNGVLAPALWVCFAAIIVITVMIVRLMRGMPVSARVSVQLEGRRK